MRKAWPMRKVEREKKSNMHACSHCAARHRACRSAVQPHYLRILIDVDLRAGAEWPLAVIYDVSGHYTCTVDRSASGHDPSRPCPVGEKCRIVGTFRKIGQTYSIKTIVSVNHLD